MAPDGWRYAGRWITMTRYGSNNKLPEIELPYFAWVGVDPKGDVFDLRNLTRMRRRRRHGRVASGAQRRVVFVWDQTPRRRDA